MRQISDGHEIRPRGGLLLVTTLHFYLHRYFPVAIDRSMREHSFLENLHMGNQGVSDLLRRPASGPFARLTARPRYHCSWKGPTATCTVASYRTQYSGILATEAVGFAKGKMVTIAQASDYCIASLNMFNR